MIIWKVKVYINDKLGWSDPALFVDFFNALQYAKTKSKQGSITEIY